MKRKKEYHLRDFGVTKHEKILANGLKVIFIEKPYSPIYARMTISAGSLLNPSDNGLAHFTEHMIVGASKKYPKKEMMASIINSIGGSSNASTSLEWMDVKCRVAPPDHLPSMKLHFQETLGNMYITEKLFLKEKRVITAETTDRISNPAYAQGRFLESKFSGGTAWYNTNLGNIEAMQAIRKEDVEHFFVTYCVVENMELVISGGCTMSDVENTFGDISFLHGERQVLLPTDPLPLAPNQRIFYERDVPQRETLIVFKGPDYWTRESVVIKFALNFAHSGLDSRFLTTLRNQKGLVYSASLIKKPYGCLQYIGTAYDVPIKKADEAIQVTLDCYDLFCREGMSKIEIQQRINRQYFMNRIGYERSIDWVNSFSGSLYNLENQLVGDFPDIYNLWETITPEEVLAVLQKYITLDNFHLIYAGKEPSKMFN